MKQTSELLAPRLPASGRCGVLLFNVAPVISTMLMWWLELAEYSPVELVRGAEALEWLADSHSGQGRRAAVFDLSMPIDPAFLRQVHDIASVTVGIGGGPMGGVSMRVCGEWVDAILPRSFRVPRLLTILEEHVGKR